MNRIQYIDRLKGFAILLVVMGHFYLFPLNAHANISLFPRFIGSFHMQLFMFVSGFLGVICCNDVKALFSKATKRILSYVIPMYIIGWILAFYCYTILEGKPSLTGSICETAYWGSWYWYLKNLVLFTLLMLPINYLKSKIQVVSFFCLLFFLFLFGWKFSGVLNSLFCLEHATCYFPFYALGYFVRKFDLSKRIFDNKYITSGALILYLLLMFIDISEVLFANIVMRYLRPIMAIVPIFHFFSMTEKENNYSYKMFNYLGVNTLYVYLFHYFFILPINLSFVWEWAYKTNNVFFVHLLAFVLCLLISYLSVWLGKLLEKSFVLNILLFAKVKA